MGFLHCGSGVNSELTPAPWQLRFPFPYGFLPLTYLRPELEGRISVRLLHPRLLVLWQAVSQHLLHNALYFLLLSGVLLSSLGLIMNPKSGSTASPTPDSVSFLTLRARSLYFSFFQAWYLYFKWIHFPVCMYCKRDRYFSSHLCLYAGRHFGLVV